MIYNKVKMIAILMLVFSISVKATTFSEALQILQKHESIEASLFKYKASSAEAKLKASWGDPKLTIAAKNFPIDTLNDNQTPMTGIEFGISQKIPLTAKYESIESAFTSLSLAYKYEAKDKKERLTKAFWEILILKRKILEESTILKENKTWIEKILQVSRRLYVTGKVSQQALLDIQIRKSEIERDISNKNYELSQIDDKFLYLIGDTHIEEKSIPWKNLETSSTTTVDFRELSLQEKLKSKKFNLTVSKLNKIPDMTLSFGYTKRSNIDGNGDFIGARISFPLPISDERSSKYEVAVQEKLQVTKEYENFTKTKNRDIGILSKDIEKLISEIDILENKMIKFAINSRKITSMSYSVGKSSYIELLQSELKLQKFLMEKVMLEAKRDSEKVSLKYIKGEPLNE